MKYNYSLRVAKISKKIATALEFNESFKMLKESNILCEIFNYIKSNSNSKYIEEIEKIVFEYIEKHIY